MVISRKTNLNSAPSGIWLQISDAQIERLKNGQSPERDRQTPTGEHMHQIGVLVMEASCADMAGDAAARRRHLIDCAAAIVAMIAATDSTAEKVAAELAPARSRTEDAAGRVA